MAGWPSAVPSTRQWPSPGSGWATNGLSGAGAGYTAPCALCGAAWTGPALGPVSANDGLPPAFGGE